MLAHDLEELPMGGVADQLGISIPAAKARLVRARVELRSRLMRYGGKSRSAPELSRRRVGTFRRHVDESSAEPIGDWPYRVA